MNIKIKIFYLKEEYINIKREFKKKINKVN